jgi:hypothetical protein
MISEEAMIRYAEKALRSRHVESHGRPLRQKGARGLQRPGRCLGLQGRMERRVVKCEVVKVEMTFSLPASLAP